MASLLDELRKQLGLDGPDPTAVYTQDPRAVPQVQEMPPQLAVPQTPSYQKPTYLPVEPQVQEVPLTVQEKLDAAYGVVPAAVQDLIETRGQGAVDEAITKDPDSGLMHLQMDTEILGDDIQKSQGRIERLTDQIVEEQEMGLDGKWPTDELEAEKANLAELQSKATPVPALAKNPDINKVVEKASAIDPTTFMPQLGSLSLADQKRIKDAAKGAGDGVIDGLPPKDMMEGAANWLGELFKDEAVRKALIYYTGARLMGYSGSGSGMAAGQVLLKGWDNQAKSDLYDKQQKAKADANKAIDQTKTQDFWDPKTKKKITGYMSKDGSLFYQVTGKGINKKPINPASTGLVSYNKDSHLTPEESVTKLQDVSNETTERHLQTLRGGDYEDVNKQLLVEHFGNGRATRDLVALATREMAAAGKNVNSSGFTSAIQNIITKAMDEQARGQRTGNYEEAISSMYGDWREAQLTADLSDEGGVPAFIYGKATSWKSDGTPEGYDSSFEATAPDKAIFYNNLQDLTRQLVHLKKGKDGLSDVQVKAKVTPTRVAQEMAKIFKNTVMKNRDARTYWTQAAEKVDSNAFMLWMRSGGVETEDKYMGLNTSLINGMVQRLSFKTQ
jgi:hypothetical protein